MLIGVAPNAFQIWQSLLFLSILFHHSNARLPEKLDKKIQKIIVTPRLHGIYHSTETGEMNSNWSSGLTVWDFLHKTFKNDVPQNEIRIGIEDFQTIEKVRLKNMLIEPFLQRK